MKSVSKKTLRKSFLNWFFWNGCSQQAETMLGMAFGQAMAPVIEELYDTKEDRAAALQRHITLFNTEAQVGSICNGIAIGMEEQLANGNGTAEAIQEAKVALIGPTSAIGDSLWVATIIPLLLTICLSVASALTTAPWVGPVIYIYYCLSNWYLSDELEAVHLGLQGRTGRCSAIHGIGSTRPHYAGHFHSRLNHGGCLNRQFRHLHPEH